MQYLAGIMAAIAGFFAILFMRKNKELATAKAKVLDSKEADTAKTLVAAQLLTSDAKADYGKAMANLPPDYKPPTNPTAGSGKAS